MEYRKETRKIIMDKIKLITDSTCDLTQELIEKYDIHVLPLSVHIGDKSYKDGESITLTEMYDGVEKGSAFPTTSQVNPQEFHDVYKKYLDEGYKIVSFHISALLSGTIQSAEIAKDMLETEDITIVDSKGVSGVLFLALVEAGEKIKAGGTLEEVVATLEETSEKVKLLVTFDTMEYLVKGGRVPKSVGAIGGFLGIKPLISIKEGKLEMVDKARGSKKALKSLLAFIDSTPRKKDSKVVVINSLDSEVNRAVISHLEKSGIGYHEIEVGCVLGVHAGPKLVGIFVLTD
ncbi:MAG: DegV family protein [Clostridia bacterium]|nr:DegV family protein [Clostridia bacterium]